MKKALVLIILAVVLATGAVGAYTAYAQGPPGPPGPPPPRVDKPTVYPHYSIGDGVWLWWKTNDDSDRYDIYVYTSGEWNFLFRHTGGCRQGQGCNYLHRDPSPGQIYWYTIRGMTSGGLESPWSDYVKISVPWIQECETQSSPEQGPDGNPPGPTSTPTSLPTAAAPPTATATPTPTPNGSGPAGPPG